MALPLLPEDLLYDQFYRLEALVRDRDFPTMKMFLTYVRNTWIHGNIFTPRDFIQHLCFVRTNNRLESYHRVLNFRVQSSSTGMYVLVVFLFKEATNNRFLVMNLFDGVGVRSIYHSLFKNQMYKELWDKLDANVISPRMFLELSSRKVIVNSVAVQESRIDLPPDM